MKCDAYERTMARYERLAEKHPERIDKFLELMGEAVAQKSQHDTETVKKKCEKKIKLAEAYSEMMQARWQVELQMTMHSLCLPPEKKPLPTQQTQEYEVRGESESTSLLHNEEEFH